MSQSALKAAPPPHATIPIRERLIFALDLPDAESARKLVGKLGDAVHFYKLGLELFMAGGYFELLDWLAAQGKKIFVDLKFFDIPATVAGAGGSVVASASSASASPRAAARASPTTNATCGERQPRCS